MSNLIQNPFCPLPLHPSDGAGIRLALQRDGVCVVANILSETEQNDFQDLFWEAIQKRNSKILREDVSTWTAENTDWYGTFGAGQYKHYGMAQEGHCWLLRKNKTIRQIFEEGVYGSNGKEDCCVSLDGCAALFRPATSGLKLHVDIVPGMEGWDWGSIQASYSLYPVEVNEECTKATGGFVCVVGSHRQYAEWWADEKKRKSFKPPSKHWFTLRDDSPLQQQVQLVTSPANSLILWRSDLLHKNYGGDFTTAELTAPGEPPRLARLVQFVTFQPKRYRSEASLLRKAESVVDGVCNNHWASLSSRVPIVPFPAWSDGAKKIPIVLPFAHLQTPSSDTSTSKEEEAVGQKRKLGSKRVSKGLIALNSLPADIQELL